MSEVAGPPQQDPYAQAENYAKEDYKKLGLLGKLCAWFTFQRIGGWLGTSENKANALFAEMKEKIDAAKSAGIEINATDPPLKKYGMALGAGMIARPTKYLTTDKYPFRAL